MNRRPERRTSRNLHHARSLRSRLTVPEQRLWRGLRARWLAGLKFVRQMPVAQYIADFACRDRHLIIEVDGESHTGRSPADRAKQQALESAGWRVVRVTNNDVLTNLEGVLCMVVAAAGLDPAAWSDGRYGQLPEDTC